MIKRLLILSIAACVSCSMFGFGMREHEIYDDEMNAAVTLKNSQSTLSIKSFLGYEFGKSAADLSIDKLDDKKDHYWAWAYELKTPWRGFKKGSFYFTHDKRLKAIYLNADTDGSSDYHKSEYEGWSSQELLMEGWKIVDMFEKKYHITMTKEKSWGLLARFEGLNTEIKIDVTSKKLEVTIENKEVGRKDKPHTFDNDDGADRI